MITDKTQDAKTKTLWKPVARETPLFSSRSPFSIFFVEELTVEPDSVVGCLPSLAVCGFAGSIKEINN